MADRRHRSSIIYDAASSEDWPRVLELCSSVPRFASHKGSDGGTALHLACVHQCHDAQVLEALLDASPESLLVQDNKGMVPLHHACQWQQPATAAEVVGRLLHLFPEQGRASASVRDRKGRTPLFYAERHGLPLIEEMLRALVPANASSERIDDGAAEVDDVAGRRKSLEMERQTSFARSFFNSSSSSANFVAPHDLLGDDRSDSPISWMEDAMRQQRQYQQEQQQQHHHQQGGWGAAAAKNDNTATLLEQHEQIVSDEADLPGGFGKQDILEQYRIMAKHEALIRLKKTTGLDMEESGPFSKDSNMQTTRIDDAAYRKARLIPQFPAPRRVTATNVMPKLQEPELPSLSRNTARVGRKSQIVPEVIQGVLVPSHRHSSRSSFRQVESGEKLVKCLGCKSQLGVKKTAMYVSCPNCGAESPAISIRQEALASV